MNIKERSKEVFMVVGRLSDTSHRRVIVQAGPVPLRLALRPVLHLAHDILTPALHRPRNLNQRRMSTACSGGFVTPEEEHHEELRWDAINSSESHWISCFLR